MAPPTTKLRLSSIDPDQLGRDVEDAALRHVSRLALPLSPGATVSVVDERDDVPRPTTTIGFTVRDLAAYAVRGEPLDDVVEAYMVDLLDVFATPLGSDDAELAVILAGEREVDDLTETTVVDRLALVACAALGRERLATNKPIRPSWLAALAGVSSQQVRLLARTGDGLERVDDGITAKSAKRWLKSRGAG